MSKLVPARHDVAPRLAADARRDAPPAARTNAEPSVGAAPAEVASLDNAAATDVLAFVSHELRQPLAAMRIWLNLLEDELGESLTPEARDHVAQIRASVTWMAELIAGRLATELQSRGQRS